jgi:hypothetical protein
VPEYKTFTVRNDEGLNAMVVAKARFLDDTPERVMRLDDGREFLVPAEDLETMEDGTFRLRVPLNQLRPVVSAVTPPQTPETRPYSSEQRSAVSGVGSPLTAPLFRDAYAVEHVPINRMVDEPPNPRQEDDVLILPVVEEVLVVEKRWIIREEVRVTKRREQLADTERQILRRDELPLSS